MQEDNAGESCGWGNKGPLQLHEHVKHSLPSPALLKRKRSLEGTHTLTERTVFFKEAKHKTRLIFSPGVLTIQRIFAVNYAPC